MKVTPLAIPEVKLITPKVFGDARGYFMESWNAQRFREAGLDLEFVQDNQSGSRRGTLRGLHYQIKRPQGKLVRVTNGTVFDVAVDMRAGSPTFGAWVGGCLSGENRQMLWVPEGFAHGFYVMSEFAEFQYKCTDVYAPEFERTVMWNDPDIGIDWPLEGTEPLLSEKDANAVAFSQAEAFP